MSNVAGFSPSHVHRNQYIMLRRHELKRSHIASRGRQAASTQQQPPSCTPASLLSCLVSCCSKRVPRLHRPHACDALHESWAHWRGRRDAHAWRVDTHMDSPAARPSAELRRSPPEVQVVATSLRLLPVDQVRHPTAAPRRTRVARSASGTADCTPSDAARTSLLRWELPVLAEVLTS